MDTELGGAAGFALPAREISHRLYVDHLLSEYAVFKNGRKRPWYDWRLPKSKPDNHWLDTLLMAIVSASIAGVSIIEKAEVKTETYKRKGNRRKRQKVSY